ncbi:MAG: DMT family transporter [Planctomycetia bacterium]|nr:DMT family transporter [Planctomycetia bacterium]
MKKILPSERPEISLALLFPLVAAFFYALSSVCMRAAVVEEGAELPFLAIREGLTCLVALPIYLWQLQRGTTPHPGAKILVAFLAAALAVQLFGNIAQMISFRFIGMGVSVAASWAGTLVFAPMIGWFLLSEPFQKKARIATLITLCAVFFLGAGANLQTESALGWHNALALVFVILSVLAGGVFSLSNGLVQKLTSLGNSPFLAVVALPGAGLISLTLLEQFLHGGAGWSLLTQWTLFLALSAGVANFIAFFALTLGLHYLGIVRVSLINLLQLIFVPLMGYFLFAEPINACIASGIFLTLCGVVVANKPSSSGKQDDREGACTQ